MTANPDASPDRLGVSAADLLGIAQNQKIAAEVLEQILEHPNLTPEVVVALLRHPGTPGSAMARLAERAGGRVLETFLGALERVGRWVVALEALLRNPAVPEVKHPTIQRHLEAARKRDREAEGAKKNLQLMLKDLPVGQRLALAKKGNKDVRMILIKDSNEMVALEVVSSPRITDGEVLMIATMRDVSDKILRYIGNHRKYRQNRQIVTALLNNPRTPVGVSLSLGINGLSDRELVELAKNRNVPAAVARVAEQILDRRKALPPQTGGGR